MIFTLKGVIDELHIVVLSKCEKKKGIPIHPFPAGQIGFSIYLTHCPDISLLCCCSSPLYNADERKVDKLVAPNRCSKLSLFSSSVATPIIFSLSVS